MKIVLSIVACLFSITGFAQTKLISFRSHSGNNANFRTAVENNLFDIGRSNFGLPEIEKVDEVIRVSKRKIIVRKSLYEGNRKVRRFISSETLTKANASDFFEANDLQSLKAAVQRKYNNSPLDSVKFIGFGDKFKGSKNPPKKDS